jgi:hypothetical protein
MERKRKKEIPYMEGIPNDIGSEVGMQSYTAGGGGLSNETST